MCAIHANKSKQIYFNCFVLFLHFTSVDNSAKKQLCSSSLIAQKDKLHAHFRVKHFPTLGSEREHAIRAQKSVEFLLAHCSLSNASLSYDMTKTPKYSRFSAISLVVTFNMKIYMDNILMIKHLYGVHFKSIVFCGDGITQMLDKSDTHSFSYIDYYSNNGKYHYYCMTKAIELNANVKGYLLMSDDILLKYWSLDELDAGKVWFPATLECSHEYANNVGWQWHLPHVNTPYYHILNYFRDIQRGTASNLAEEDYEWLRSYMCTKYLNTRKTKHAHGPIICHTMAPENGLIGSDIFYLPKSKFEIFHFMSAIFRKFDYFLELAVPGLLSGLDAHAHIEILKGTYSWNYDNGRRLNFSLYNDTGAFYHPFKYSLYTASELGKQFCEMYIQEKLNHMS